MQAAQQAGMASMDLGTLRSYIIKHRTFIEYKKDGVTFHNVPNRTSAYIFDYDKLLEQDIQFKVTSDFDNIYAND